MPNNIQKYYGGNKPTKTTNGGVFRHLKTPFAGIVLAVILLGLGIFVANGFIKGRVGIAVTFVIVSVIAILSFNKYRKKISNQQYWVGVFGSIVFFLRSLFNFSSVQHRCSRIRTQ